jgi:formylmethanofuran dehydrogenase subunit E
MKYYAQNILFQRQFICSFISGENNSDFVDDDNDEYGEETNVETIQTDSETDREEDGYSAEEEVKRVKKPRGKRQKKVSKVCCPTCNEKFASQENFLSHMSNVHLQIADFQCW